MKTSSYLKLFMLCFCLGLVACSSDDSNDDPNPPVTEGIFTKRVLVEDYTSIHCGNCPRVAHAIDLLGQQTNNMVAVGIHGPFGGHEDPFNFNYDVLANEYDILGLPTAKLNRTTTWIFPEADNVAQAKALTGSNASIGLAINPILNGANLDIALKIKFGADFSTQNLKYVVYVLESGLTADQLNYTPYYNGDEIVTNFEFNHVLRASLTNLLGDAIPAEETNLENVYTKNISVAVPDTNVSDTANMHIVAFVVDAKANVLNVRSADIGDHQQFETEQQDFENQFKVETHEGKAINDGDIFSFGELGLPRGELPFYVYNTSSSPINMLIEFVSVQNADGSMMQLCFGQCYTSIITGESYPLNGVITIQPGEHQNSSGDHFLNSDPGDGSEVIDYKFRFYQVDDSGKEIGNSLSLTYRYDPLL